MGNKMLKNINVNDPKGNMMNLRESAESKAFAEWLGKLNSMVEPPSFLTDKKTNGFSNDSNSGEMDGVRVLKATGNPSIVLGMKLLLQVAQTQFEGKDITDKMATAFQMMLGLHPDNELEGYLIAQMVGTYNLAMELMRRSILGAQSPDVSESQVNGANKLMSMFIRQVEALQKLRGNTGSQKVTVEHVYVGAGGQAIVGHVDAESPREGDNKNSKDKPHAKQQYKR